MTNSIAVESISIHTSVESLPVATHNNIPVITTELLAQLYGTERQRVTNNFNRNKERFVEGKHYFLAKGESLENLKNSLRGFQPIASNVRKLILWTERGAARQAKMLETDQAWDVFEKLEDCYFSHKKIVAPAIPVPSAHPNSVNFLMDGEPTSVIFEESRITQLNALFECADFLSTDMWPHLSALLPGLKSEYRLTFETLGMVSRLLKNEKKQCKEMTAKIFGESAAF